MVFLRLLLEFLVVIIQFGFQQICPDAIELRKQSINLLMLDRVRRSIIQMLLNEFLIEFQDLFGIRL